VGGFGTHREVCERLLDDFAHYLALPASPAPLPAVQLLGPPTASTVPRAAAAVPDASLPPQPVPVGN
jgi:hypothetical protein